jgi:hypothetical protein
MACKANNLNIHLPLLATLTENWEGKNALIASATQIKLNISSLNTGDVIAVADPDSNR